MCCYFKSSAVYGNSHDMVSKVSEINEHDRFCLLACVIRVVITWCMYLVITILFISVCD